jgi:hypothetical protein
MIQMFTPINYLDNQMDLLLHFKRAMMSDGPDGFYIYQLPG